MKTNTPSLAVFAAAVAVSSLVAAVSAQTSTTGSGNSNGNSNSNSDSPYIPNSGISSSCSTFLQDLDSNPELASCSQSLLSATSLFDPSSGQASSSSSSSVQSTLSNLCSSSSQCSKSLITQHLTYFTGNCSAELAANQAVVKSNYDVLYVLYPFTKAVCTKDTKTGSYCALEVSDEEAVDEASSSSSSSAASASSSGASSGNGNGTVFSNDNNNASNTTSSNTAGLFIQAPHIALNNLYMHVADATKNAMSRFRAKRQNSHGGLPSTGPANSSSSNALEQATTVTAENALLPNATTFRTTNLPFLFLSGEMGQAQLCTDCTKEILASYVAFETDYPYGTGLASSPILGAQAKLWNDIGKVCGSGFLSAITAQSGNDFSAAGKSATVSVVVLLAGLAGFAVLF